MACWHALLLTSPSYEDSAWLGWSTPATDKSRLDSISLNSFCTRSFLSTIEISCLRSALVMLFSDIRIQLHLACYFRKKVFFALDLLRLCAIA